MVDIIEGESLIGHVNEYDIILVGTNCYQSMRNGFPLEVARKYPYVREINCRTRYGDPAKLGTIVECRHDGDPMFILMFISFGFNFKGGDQPFIDYDALKSCLGIVRKRHDGERIATTMLGCTRFDGNADKDRVLEIINREMEGTSLTVYDYEQESFRKLTRREYNEAKTLERTNKRYILKAKDNKKKKQQ